MDTGVCDSFVEMEGQNNANMVAGANGGNQQAGAGVGVGQQSVGGQQAGVGVGVGQQPGEGPQAAPPVDAPPGIASPGRPAGSNSPGPATFAGMGGGGNGGEGSRGRGSGKGGSMRMGDGENGYRTRTPRGSPEQYDQRVFREFPRMMSQMLQSMRDSSGGQGNVQGERKRVSLDEKYFRRIDKFEGDVMKYKGGRFDLLVAIGQTD